MMSKPECREEERVVNLPGDFDKRLGDLVLNRSWIVEGHYEEKSWLYWLLLPALLLTALYCALKYYAYVALVRPQDKNRLMLGPKRGLWFFDGAHWLLDQTRNGVTSWRALAAIYSAPLALNGKDDWRALVAKFWFGQPEAQAVRNRLRLVYFSVYERMVGLYWTKKVHEINMLSLASGSAQSAIEAAANFQAKYPPVKVRLTLVDIDRGSLKMAEELAARKGVTVDAVCAKIRDFLETQPNGRFQIVEEAGFLDYRSRASFIVNCASVWRLLAPGGIFVAAQIGPSPWSLVTRWITGWPLLIRRPRREFARLLRESGIPPQETKIDNEPHGIYFVAVCRRVD